MGAASLVDSQHCVGLVLTLGHFLRQGSPHGAVAALVLFACKWHVWSTVGLGMASTNVAGNLHGLRLASRHGPLFEGRAFILVVAALTLKTGRDALLRGRTSTRESRSPT